MDLHCASTRDLGILVTAGLTPIRVLRLHRDLTYHRGVPRAFLTAAFFDGRWTPECWDGQPATESR